MNASFAGVLRRHGSTAGAEPDPSRALGPGTVSIDRGPLRLAVSGNALTADGALICLLDGSLYNQQALAEQLGMAPHSSTEALLSGGYRRWGRGLPARLRGDFLLLVWDEEHSEGLIARDQLGVRCAYLADTPGGGVCFAGELHRLLEMLPTRPPPDPVSVTHWISASNRPGAATLYAGTRRLNPGCMLLLDRHGAREHVYWSPRFREPQDAPSAELALQLKDALLGAVSCRTPSSEHVGVLMSGGLDSSCIAAAAAHASPGGVSAYSGVFPEHPATDESALIEDLREALALPGVTVEVRTGGLVASALAHAQTWAAPLLGWGDFWTIPLLHAARAQGVTVTLGGDGGDEVFGTRTFLLADELLAGRPGRALGLARELPGAGERPPRKELAAVFAVHAIAGALPHRLHNACLRLGASPATPKWLTARGRRDLSDSSDPLAWKRLQGPRWWAHIAHGITRGVEETGVFEHQRRRAALVGVDARHPLFDLELVELALRQPPLATFDRHRGRPLLRAAMEGMVPDSVRLRAGKAWFHSLILDTLVGPDLPAVQALLGDRTSELRAFVDQPRMLEGLLNNERARMSNPFGWMHLIWRLVTAECWLKSQSESAQIPAAIGDSPPSAACLAPREVVPFSALTPRQVRLG